MALCIGAGVGCGAGDSEVIYRHKVGRYGIVIAHGGGVGVINIGNGAHIANPLDKPKFEHHNVYAMMRI